MQAETVKRLIDLNRAFYAAFARDFSETRSSERLNITPIMPYLTNGVKLLEVGCGNGRLVERLDREGFAFDYLGVDLTRELLTIAQIRARELQHITAEFRASDITASGWSQVAQDQAPFALILMLAVLHHVPSYDLRERVLRDLRSLLKPGGRLLMSNWQYESNERLRRKIVPWPAGWPEAELEPGDALVDWKRGGEGLRYVHLLTEQEVCKLAEATGFQVERQFLADANLNLYSVLSR
ncbi:MAG: class I SAM-dependent methyltransferase [Anaerolineae bacterium]